jgi:hypothetical protein
MSFSSHLEGMAYKCKDLEGMMRLLKLIMDEKQTEHGYAAENLDSL